MGVFRPGYRRVIGIRWHKTDRDQVAHGPQVMASRLREGIVERKPEVKLRGEVECDEVYMVAGHKGHPEAVRKKGGSDGAGG